jgi:MFS family permease
MGLFGILIGRLNDRFGPRILMSFAAVFFGAGFCMMAGVNSLAGLFIIFGLIFGIGLSAIDVIALTTIARWFEKNRGRMTGLVKVGTGAGQFTFPILASVLIAWFGWKSAFIIIGSAAFVILFLIAQFLRRDPVSFYKGVEKFRELPSNQDEGVSFSSALSKMELWVICLVNLLVVFCLLSILIHIVPHARDIGISPHRAAGVLSTIGAVSMLGRFLSGIAIDHTGSKRIMSVCFGLLIVSLVWLTRSDSLWKLYLFACIYGIAHGGFFTAISPIIAELFGIRAHGSLFGMTVFFGTTGGALGPIITGYLFDRTQSYLPAFWMLIIISCIGFGLLICLKVKKRN